MQSRSSCQCIRVPVIDTKLPSRRLPTCEALGLGGNAGGSKERHTIASGSKTSGDLSGPDGRHGETGA